MKHISLQDLLPTIKGNSFVPLLTLLIFLSVFSAGLVQYPVDMDHLSGTINAFEYFYTHNFQFGRDFIDNSGPYAFLYTPALYCGGAFFSKILSFSLVCLFFAFFSAVFIRDIPGMIRKIFSFIFITYFSFQSYLPLLAYEVIPKAAIFFSYLFLISHTHDNPKRFLIIELLCALFYAYLSLQKTCNSFLILILILLAAVYFLLNERRIYAMVLIFSFTVMLSTLWIIAHQRIPLLLQFYLANFSFMKVYQEALSVPSSSFEFIFGIIILFCSVLLSIFRIILAHKLRNLKNEIFYSLFFVICAFASWKHGMIGTGIHTGIYFNFIACLIPYLFFYKTTLTVNKGLSQIAAYSGFLLFSCIMYIFYTLNPVYAKNFSLNMFDEFNKRLNAVRSYRPSAKLVELKDKIGRLEEEYRLPSNLKAKIKDSRVDEFGFEPSIILRNHLNYSPRPVPVNFIAINKCFKDFNKNYYQDYKRAPAFILAKVNGMQINDSSAFLEILWRYTPIYLFHDWVILERNASELPGRTGRRKFIETKTFNFDTRINITDLDKKFLWCSFDIRPTPLGKLTSFFYKPMPISFNVKSGKKIFEQTVSFESLKSGVLLPPLILDNIDLVKLYQNSSNSTKKWEKVDEIEIKYRSAISRFCYSPHIVASFYALDTSVPVRRSVGDVIILYFAQGVYAQERNNREFWRWSPGFPNKVIILAQNFSEIEKEITLSFRISRASSKDHIGDETLNIKFNENKIKTYIIKSEIPHTECQVKLNLKPGENIINLVYSGKTVAFDPRELAFAISDPTYRIGDTYTQIPVR